MSNAALRQAPFVTAAKVAGRLYRVLATAREITLSASNAKSIAARGGDKTASFRPITDFVNEMARDTIALVSRINEAALFVEDFSAHVRFMEGFHRRWMPSNRAKQDWIDRVRKLDIDIMAPQHGRLFKGDDVQRFLDWFEQLEVASAIGEQ